MSKFTAPYNSIGYQGLPLFAHWDLVTGGGAGAAHSTPAGFAMLAVILGLRRRRSTG